jgi:hypothetical protein
METINKTEIPEGLACDLVLSESMKNQLRQICIYASLTGIDMDEIRIKLTDEGILPCRDKNSSKKALSEIYDHVACSF